MVAPGPASIVVIPFPFSDLSGTKLRPAVVLADAGRGDWLLCQVTSNPYSDSNAIRITNKDLQKGVLTSAVSFARPIKLFAANETVMLKRVAILRDETFKAILSTTIESLRKNMPK
jgi:mRNA interferase MazF